MTPEEAYNKGLDAAENAVVENFTLLMNSGDSLKFRNPKMEELRQILKEKLSATLPPKVSRVYNSLEGEYLDDVADQFGRILTDAELPILVRHDKLQRVGTAYFEFMKYIREIATDAKSPIGKRIEKDLKIAIDFINS